MSKAKQDVNGIVLEQLARGVVIFDLDGTLFDDSARLTHLRSGLPGDKPTEDDYRRYHKDMKSDPVHQSVLNVLNVCIEHGFRIVFMTARPGCYWDQTTHKIKSVVGHNFVFGAGYELLMRPANNKLSSPRLKKDMVDRFLGSVPKGTSIVAAFDDRPDVTEMLKQYTVPFLVMGGDFADVDEVRRHLDNHANLAAIEAGSVAQARTAADILTLGGETFRERNSNYRDNAVQVGQVMQVLFPNGVTLKTQADHHFYHLFELMVVKLTRFANSDLKHIDSIHDLMVYAAMCENVIEPHSIKVH